MNIPFKETILIDIGIGFLIIIITKTLIFGTTRIWDIFRDESDKKYQKEGCFGCFFRSLALIVLFWIGITLIAFAALLQTFQNFTKQKLIAEVTCEWQDRENKVMRFTITEFDGPYAGKSRQQIFPGDEWFIKGHLLRWKNWAKIFNLDTKYRITTIGSIGQFRKSHRKRILKKSDLMPYIEDLKWAWFYKIGATFLPIKDIKRIDLVASPMDNTTFKIYITDSGFTVERETTTPNIKQLPGQEEKFNIPENYKLISE